jgi:hypothetical protein
MLGFFISGRFVAYNHIMRRNIFQMVVGIMCSVAMTGCHRQVDPATSRLSIKHGLDPGTASITLTPKAITIGELNAEKMPDDNQANLEDLQNTRVGPFENQVWEVDAHIKSIQLRKDGDYYMEIQDSDGKKSVMEVPDPKLCQGSPLEPKIAATRKALEARYQPTDQKKDVDDDAQLQGVGFYGWHGRPTGGRLMPGLDVSFTTSASHSNHAKH